MNHQERKKQKYQLRTDYFRALKETSEAVVPYVENFINDHFHIFPELRSLLIEKYRLGKTQLRPAQARFSYELVGGQDWKRIVPACAALTLKEICYYCFDDYFDLDLRNEKLPLLGAPFLSTSYRMVAELDNSFSAKQKDSVTKELYMLDELNAQGFLIEPFMDKNNEENYLKKVYGYNFWEQALRIGGILGNGSEQDITRLGEVGKNIGMGYIIANDTWDFGNKLISFKDAISYIKNINCWAGAELLEKQFKKHNKILRWSDDTSSLCEIAGEMVDAWGGAEFATRVAGQFHPLLDYSTIATFLTQLPEEMGGKYGLYSTTIQKALERVYGDCMTFHFKEKGTKKHCKLLYKNEESLEKYLADHSKERKIIDCDF